MTLAQTAFAAGERLSPRAPTSNILAEPAPGYENDEIAFRAEDFVGNMAAANLDRVLARLA